MRYPEPLPANISFEGQTNSTVFTMKLKDFATKMREIEINLLDTRAEVERRLSAG